MIGSLRDNFSFYPLFHFPPNIHSVKKSKAFFVCYLTICHVQKSLIPSCRDEFNRLVELLNSRAVDLPNVEQGKENTNLTSRKNDEGLVIAQGLPKVSNERRHEESKGAIWGSSTPLGLSNVSIATCRFELFPFNGGL